MTTAPPKVRYFPNYLKLNCFLSLSLVENESGNQRCFSTLLLDADAVDKSLLIPITSEGRNGFTIKSQFDRKLRTECESILPRRIAVSMTLNFAILYSML